MLAVVTALGGGTLRDVLLDRTPIWISDTAPLWAALAGAALTLAYVRFRRPPWSALLVADAVEIAVQVNGKLRGNVTVPADASKEDVLAAARAHENVARYLNDGGTVRKEVVVPGRLVNFVVA